MATVLVTGFEPFEKDSVNPSWEAARALDGWEAGRARVHARRLACVFGSALQQLDAAIDELKPQLVLCLGLAGGRFEFTPERVAINVDDGRIADNAGHQPIDLPVVAGAPAAYFSTLPIKAMVRALRATGIPASVSNSAGTFVCNHVFFGLMHRIATRPVVAGMRGGFVHVPYLPEQAARLPGQPSMALETQVAALRLAVTTSLSVHDDVRETGGQLH
jgi:pyroglutamyl-peptidase